MKGAPIDKALCEYLKQYRRGQESAASSKELEAAFHVKGTELRRAVNRLRCDGHPICSDATGYFYAARQSVSAPFENVDFRRNGVSFLTGQHTGVIQP